MTTQLDEENCPLCGGTGEVSISKDGTYEGTDYYGCPMCISRERDEEARLIETQRDELLAVNADLMQAARRALEALEAQHVEHFMSMRVGAITALREALEAQEPWTPDDLAYRPGGLSQHAAVEQERDVMLEALQGIAAGNTDPDVMVDIARAAIRARSTQ